MKHKIILKKELSFKTGSDIVKGNLVCPDQAKGLVIFCHGINSSRHSPRNRHLAAIFNRYGIATLLVSLEKVDEDLYSKGSNLEELANRAVEITMAVRKENKIKNLPIGFFASGTGAAVALAASTQLHNVVKTIVCRDARPEAAIEILAEVKVPVLLLCAEKDEEGLAINEMAKGYLKAPCKLEVISEASYLFEEDGKLDEVAEIAIKWFRTHMKNEARLMNDANHRGSTYLIG